MKPRVKMNGNSPYGEWEAGDTGVVDGYCRGGDDIPWRDEDSKLFIEAFVDDNKFKMAENVTIQIRKKQ